MPASKEGAAPAKTGFCALEPGTRIKETEKSRHFGNTFIPSRRKNLLASVSDTRSIVILSVDCGPGQAEVGGTSIKVHAGMARGNVH